MSGRLRMAVAVVVVAAIVLAVISWGYPAEELTKFALTRTPFVDPSWAPIIAIFAIRGAAFVLCVALFFWVKRGFVRDAH